VCRNATGEPANRYFRIINYTSVRTNRSRRRTTSITAVAASSSSLHLCIVIIIMNGKSVIIEHSGASRHSSPLSGLGRALERLCVCVFRNYIITHRNVTQRTATRCHASQHGATYRNMLQRYAALRNARKLPQCATTHRNVSQRSATRSTYRNRHVGQCWHIANFVVHER